jgi:hypothetical protein
MNCLTQVDLRAYCSKHSTARLAKVSSAGDIGVDGSDAQDKSPGDDELAKKANDAGIPADSSISEGKTSAAEKRSEERMFSSVAALQFQNADGLNASYEKRPSDAEIELPQLPALTVTEMDTVHDSGVVVGEVLDNARVALDSSAAGEQLNFPNQIYDKKKVWFICAFCEVVPI